MNRTDALFQEIIVAVSAPRYATPPFMTAQSAAISGDNLTNYEYEMRLEVVAGLNLDGMLMINVKKKCVVVVFVTPGCCLKSF